MPGRSPGRTYISQGQFAIGTRPDDLISTILGSCVSVTLHDPEAGIGGMNHILLPEGSARTGHQTLYAASLMEQLINALLKAGADRRRLVAKVFGGAAMLSIGNDIGAKNARFAFDYLGCEGIACIGHDVGGTNARSVRFWPGTGRAMMKYARQDPVERPVEPPAGNDVELF